MWTWDKNKDRANLRKHGLSFSTAQLVFNDPLALSRMDSFDFEERWQTMGMIDPNTIIVVHTLLEQEGMPDGSSAPVKQLHMKGNCMKKELSKVYTVAEKRELKTLAAMKDKHIDRSDIPEQLDWSDATRGKFYKPIKQQLTLRLDADLIHWFKKNGTGYQTRINTALRDYVKKQGRKSA